MSAYILCIQSTSDSETQIFAWKRTTYYLYLPFVLFMFLGPRVVFIDVDWRFPVNLTGEFCKDRDVYVGKANKDGRLLLNNFLF